MNKNCNIIKDLIPLYVENLTSEDSNQFVQKHLNTCKDCTHYLRNVERDVLNNDAIDVSTDKNDQKLMKGIKNKINKMMACAILIGVLIGMYGSMLFFNMNEFQSILVIYPIATFFIGFLSFILFKNLWIGPIATLLAGIISAFTFFNITFWIWIIIYACISLLGSFIGKGTVHILKRANK